MKVSDCWSVKKYFPPPNMAGEKQRLTTISVGWPCPQLESCHVLTRPLFRRMPAPNSPNYVNWAWNQRVTLLVRSRSCAFSTSLQLPQHYLRVKEKFFTGVCEAIKVDLLCFAPARDENTLWAWREREGSWDSQKDYLELESWDVPRTKALLTCSSYEQPLIKWWSFMCFGIHWALELRERGPPERGP